MEDQEIRVLLTRLARPNASGGQVIERAALLAAGGDFPAIIEWITSHAGQPESTAMKPVRGGLHSARMHDAAGPASSTPQRYVLPAASLA